jgi:hypothetical protein
MLMRMERKYLRDMFGLEGKLERVYGIYQLMFAGSGLQIDFTLDKRVDWVDREWADILVL